MAAEENTKIGMSIIYFWYDLQNFRLVLTKLNFDRKIPLFASLTFQISKLMGYLGRIAWCTNVQSICISEYNLTKLVVCCQRYGQYVKIIFSTRLSNLSTSVNLSSHTVNTWFLPISTNSQLFNNSHSCNNFIPHL